MFIQQPFRVQANPILTQASPSLLTSALRQHYVAKARDYSTDVVKVLRIDCLNPVLVGTNTQADILLSIEADTVDFFNQFAQSFIREEVTPSFTIHPIS